MISRLLRVSGIVLAVCIATQVPSASAMESITFVGAIFEGTLSPCDTSAYDRTCPTGNCQCEKYESFKVRGKTSSDPLIACMPPEIDFTFDENLGVNVGCTVFFFRERVFIFPGPKRQ